MSAMKYKLIVILMSLSTISFAQEDLIALVGDDSANKTYVTGAFKSSRVINSHSMEFLGKGVLDFRILHRFGTVESGIKEMFGLDDASIRIGLDYGITDGLTIGFGRSSFNKELDFFVKSRILRQSTGQSSSPVSLVWVSGAAIKTIDWPESEVKHEVKHRVSYYHTLIIGRKFNSDFTLQLSPIFVHRNFVAGYEDNNSFALGVGGRYKLTKRLALMIDYHYVASGLNEDYSSNPLAIGVDIETGGHVFQLHFSNSTGMNEKAFLTETTGKWDKAEIRFGFNISRVFNIGRSAKEDKNSKW